jgi:hypothetical protein
MGTFGEELRSWRGKRLQKEAAGILDIPVGTYVKYEYNTRTPNKFALVEIRRRMSISTASNEVEKMNMVTGPS